ncbi:hypothetical protein FKP32DRAFT_549310 [Trametes sanguinea]|nr:hypothetical protein FKP32DRAFT_549310 [Trametes sanguinea]
MWHLKSIINLKVCFKEVQHKLRAAVRAECCNLHQLTNYLAFCNISFVKYARPLRLHTCDGASRNLRSAMDRIVTSPTQHSPYTALARHRIFVKAAANGHSFVAATNAQYLTHHELGSREASAVSGHLCASQRRACAGDSDDIDSNMRSRWQLVSRWPRRAVPSRHLSLAGGGTNAPRPCTCIK